MTVIVSISLTGHVAEVDIYSYLLPLSILYSLCFSKHLNYLWSFVWWGWQLVILSGLDYYSFTLTLTTGHVESPILQTHSSFPPL